MKPVTIDMKGFCSLAGISSTTGYKLVKQKQVPHFKIGKKILFDRQLVEEWIREQSIKMEVNA